MLDRTQAQLLEEIGKRGDHALLNSGEENRQRRETRLLLERGLRFEGLCPRCSHWMSQEIAFGVTIDDHQLTRMITTDGLASAVPLSSTTGLWDHIRPSKGHNEEDAGANRDNPTLTFGCSCGQDHDGRPSGVVFAGCGAAWNQPTRNDDGDSWHIRPATPDEAEWATHIKEISAAPLARIRDTANQWRNGVTGLTAVLTAAALLRGPSDASKLHPLAKWLTLLFAAAGLASLLYGSYKALQASIGVGGYDHRLLSTHALRRYERRRAREAIGQIRLTQAFTLLGVLLVAIAGGVGFANPG
jgi:hypothetical protein